MSANSLAGSYDPKLDGELAKRGWLFSERHAYMAMSRLRRRAHDVLHALYWSAPSWFVMHRRAGAPLRFLWRTYRRTWPRYGVR